MQYRGDTVYDADFQTRVLQIIIMAVNQLNYLITINYMTLWVIINESHVLTFQNVQ